VPKRDNIKTVQKKIVKASREECVEIINEHDPELMVDSKTLFSIFKFEFLQANFNFKFNS